MKNGLLGCVNNISTHFDKIKVWAHSFQSVCDGEVALVVINATDSEIQLLKDNNIKVFAHTIDSTETINNVRLKYEIEALRQLDWDYVIVSDVFDVVFQNNPFTKIINHEITLGNEGIFHNEEPWNLDVMNKSYPDKVELVKDKYIYCSGVMGGKRQSMIDLLIEMDIITMTGEKGHDIRDQAALNIILNENPHHIVKSINPNEGWVLHCALGGPTQFYESWGFKRHFQNRWGEAKLVNNKITTADDTPYDIVHQFNRIPEWNEILTAPYVK